MNPILHSPSGSADDESKFIHYFEAAKSMASLVQQFCIRHECSALFDGIEANIWVDECAGDQRRFDNRVHVQIVERRADD